MIRRRRALQSGAFIASLALHGALFAWLVSRPPLPRPERPAREASRIEVEVSFVEPRPEPAPDIQRPPLRRPPLRREVPTPPPQPEEVATADARAGETDVPHAPSAQPRELTRGPTLTPSLEILGGGTEGPGEGGVALRGRTFRAGEGDPYGSEAARREEERFRVHGRVDGWAKDSLAEARAQRGLPHPYIGGVGEALREGLGRAEGGTPAALGAAGAAEFMLRRYADAAAEYTRTGNPGISTPGLAERQSERLKSQFGGEAKFVQALTQAGETSLDLAYGKPLLALTLELRLSRDGKPVSAPALLQRSGSDAFDAFVLRVIPGALAELGPVPEDALRGQEELRSVWLIEGWASLPPKLNDAMLMYGVPGMMGIGGDVLLKEIASSEQFDFRAKLLRVY